MRMRLTEHTAMSLAALLLCLLSCSSTASGYTVLTVITPGPQSHLFGMRKITEEMHSRGINVVYLASDGDAPRLTPSIPTITYHFNPAAVGWKTGKLEVKGKQDMAQLLPRVLATMAKAADALFDNSTAMAAVQDLKPDLILGTFMYPAVPILASRQDLPFINYFPAGAIEPFFTTLWRGSGRRVFLPNPLSYHPQMDLHVTSQHLTFSERLQNAYIFLKFHYNDYRVTRPIVQSVFRKYGLDLDTPEERRRLVMHLISADFAVEWLRPMTPNAKLVGPILPQAAQPLPQDLEEFMDGAGEQGVMLVATGTVATLGLRERLAMAQSFAKLPLRVLWRLSAAEVPDQAALDELNLGNNTKVATWLPQNDVLGHPQTKIFLSHCGANSLYEAAYHGVPIVGLPFFADQPGNADKAVAKGFGVRISHGDVLTDALQAAVMRVLSDRQYAQAARMVSVKLTARKRTPVQEAVDWIEHTLATHGEAYLHTPEDVLSFVQRHNLDVMATFVGGAGVILVVAWSILRALLTVLARGQKLKTA